jgi:hypothetical protein
MMTMARGGEILPPVLMGLYRRRTSGGGAEALIDCVDIRSLDGGLGRTWAARLCRIGMPGIVASLGGGLGRIARVNQNAADSS